MAYMLDEIHEQGAVIKDLLDKEMTNAEKLGHEIKNRGIRFIIIAARGTSDNAGTYGKYLFEYNNGIPVSLAAPSIFTLYDASLRLDDALVIGISQSGEGADVNHVVKRAGDMGALTIGITNNPSSGLAKTAHHLILCHAGEEKAVAATKTYTAELAALLLLSYGIKGNKEILDGLNSAASATDGILELKDRIESIVERYRYIDELVVASRGFNHATAMEVALKLQETSYIGAKGFSGADFLHGPFAMIAPGFPLLVFAPPGKGSASLGDLFKKTKAAGAELIVVSSSDEYLAYARTPLKVNSEVPELFSPIPYVVVGQLFAYYLAISRGFDPDRPRGLTKVTSTV